MLDKYDIKIIIALIIGSSINAILCTIEVNGTWNYCIGMVTAYYCYHLIDVKFSNKRLKKEQ